MIGRTAIFASAFCFYLSTLVIRWSQGKVAIDPAFFVFFRFLLGFLVVSAVMVIGRQPLKPVKYHLLIGRTLSNCVAVFCFFTAVTRTSLAEANILNMTYPLFIALFSWFLLKKQRDVVAIVIVAVAFAGVWLVLAPGRVGWNPQNLWGLCSGMSASAAIIYLNVSRQYHDTNTILFFMFGLGSLLILGVFHRHIYLPDAIELYYLSLCAAFGIGGQYLLTLGFRYVTAVEGAIISSTRILLAAILGPILALEPALSVYGWIGAFLIFAANVYLAVRKTVT
ncbi:MAG: DMT family transporter [Desulfobacteraceae bacterium]|nr:DMT family transporter [Desulfobacteraceae bacterium]